MIGVVRATIVLFLLCYVIGTHTVASYLFLRKRTSISTCTTQPARCITYPVQHGVRKRQAIDPAANPGWLSSIRSGDRESSFTTVLPVLRLYDCTSKFRKMASGSIS